MEMFKHKNRQEKIDANSDCLLSVNAYIALMDHSTRSEILEGFKDCLPVLVAVAFFGMLFGATAVNNGMTFWQTVGASAAILAGASQFVLLDLFGQQVPVWSVLLAVFAVNFRHVLYSASIGRFLERFTGFQKYFGFFFLTDPSVAAGEQRASIKTLTPASQASA